MADVADGLFRRDAALSRSPPLSGVQRTSPRRAMAMERLQLPCAGRMLSLPLSVKLSEGTS